MITFQPPCYVQGCQPPDQAAQSHIQPGLECLQGWGIHSLLGQPVPVCHHPLCEKLPPNIQPKPLLSQFKTSCPVSWIPAARTLQAPSGSFLKDFVTALCTVLDVSIGLGCSSAPGAGNDSEWFPPPQHSEQQHFMAVS